MRDALNYWWRLLKFIVGVVSGPLALYLLLLWLGVFH